jgi:hypothetical protein
VLLEQHTANKVYLGIGLLTYQKNILFRSSFFPLLRHFGARVGARRNCLGLQMALQKPLQRPCTVYGVKTLAGGLLLRCICQFEFEVRSISRTRSSLSRTALRRGRRSGRKGSSEGELVEAALDRETRLDGEFFGKWSYYGLHHKSIAPSHKAT